MKTPFPELTTPRLVLRELHVKDVPRLMELLRDEEVTRYIGGGLVKHNVRGRRKAFAAGREIRWGICERERGTLIGVMDLQPINRGNRNAELGYWLGRAYWGRGYMTEALQAVLDYCFNEMNLNRVYGDHFAENPASGRVMLKCGLRYEGTHRQKVYMNGRFFDLLEYAILREEYK